MLLALALLVHWRGTGDFLGLECPAIANVLVMKATAYWADQSLLVELLYD